MTIAISDLYAAVNSGDQITSTSTKYDRTTNEFYLILGVAADTRSYLQAAELTITHDTDHKRYRAEVRLSEIKVEAGWFSQSFRIGGGWIGERFIVEPTPRYSAAKLADFDRRARALLARM